MERSAGRFTMPSAMNDSSIQPTDPKRLTVDTVELLHRAAASGRAVFTTSLGVEDMLLGELIVRERLPIEMVTLDTGRLFPETLELLAQAEARWRRRIRVLVPDARRLEQWVAINGINSIRESRAQRQECCAVRKIEPLARALEGATAWVTGLRRDQSDARARIEPVAHDAARGLDKYCPLLEWSVSDVWAWVRAENVPYNPLHDRGFASIGCAACTRAIAPGEPERAGRWWWEQASARECGLHVGGALSPVRGDAAGQGDPFDLPGAAIQSSS